MYQHRQAPQSYSCINIAQFNLYKCCHTACRKKTSILTTLKLVYTRHKIYRKMRTTRLACPVYITDLKTIYKWVVCLQVNKVNTKMLCIISENTPPCTCTVQLTYTFVLFTLYKTDFFLPFLVAYSMWCWFGDLQ